jgi:hypothetical protein
VSTAAPQRERAGLDGAAVGTGALAQGAMP